MKRRTLSELEAEVARLEQENRALAAHVERTDDDILDFSKVEADRLELEPGARADV